MYSACAVSSPPHSTQIFVSPFVSIYELGQLSIIGVVVNILRTAVHSAHDVSRLPDWSVRFHFSSFSVMSLDGCAHLLLTYELFIVEHFARLPFSPPFTCRSFPGWWVAGLYVVFLLAYFYFIWRHSHNSPHHFPIQISEKVFDILLLTRWLVISDIRVLPHVDSKNNNVVFFVTG